jgi:hypothetical protein
MRNQYAGTCYRCGEFVAPGAGHFERFKGRWRTQHADCAIKYRGMPDPERDAHREAKLRKKAEGTGRAAQKARAILRAREAQGR